MALSRKPCFGPLEMHPLEALLQLHVATDQAVITHLPFIISLLTRDALQSSPCVPKWIARINSLLTSKNNGARWAGLCLALQTGILNKDILKECSQNWISICLPILSRNEDIPNMKASIRLLDHIFFLALGISEFQRQLATPNVPKYSAALLSLAEKTENSELQIRCLKSLTRLVPFYPTLHRQLQSNISTTCFHLLSGKISGSDRGIIAQACSLLSILHLTGGKVASTTAWRKTLETSIVNAWAAFGSLRTTFPSLESSSLTQALHPTFKPPSPDPLIAIPLSIDRLKSASCLIVHLLKAPLYRPTAVGVGELVRLTLALLKCSWDTEEPPFDVQRRELEASVVPQIWDIACGLFSQMAISFKHHLNPNINWILSSVMYNCEQTTSKSHRLAHLYCLETLLSHTYTLHSAVLLNRLVKYLISRLAILLPQKTAVTSHTLDTSTNTSKRGKKRARGYDGDEVFQVGATVVCADHLDEEIVLTSLHVIELLLHNPHLSSAMRALSARLFISVLFELSRLPTASLSHNPAFHGILYNKVLVLCRKYVTSGAAGWLNNDIGLVISAIDKSNLAQGDDMVLKFMNESRRDLDMLLHPRLPPPLRSNPPLSAITLFQSEREAENGGNVEIISMDIVDHTVNPISAQSGHQGQQAGAKEASVTPTIPPQREAVLPSKSAVSFPSPMQHVASNPLPDITQSSEPVNTEAVNPSDIALGKQNKLTDTTQKNPYIVSITTLEEPGPSAPSKSQDWEKTARPIELLDDMDGEEIPEINIESDSD